MPPLICTTPTILDQSFPRNDEELYRVAESLGVIEEILKADKAHLILTNLLREIVEPFEWQNHHPILGDIRRLLCQWFLQPHERLVEINLDDIEDHNPHPLPFSCNSQGLFDFWSDEMGKMLVKHASCCSGDEFFIGIACELALCGEGLGEYDNPNNEKTFPLVGREELEQLSDAYLWEDLPPNIYNTNVSFSNACRNCYVIGATRVDPPSGGSHYKVHFEGSRSWSLDKNIDPVSEDHLQELVGITGYPVTVIKTALIYGSLPQKNILRFEADL